MRPAASGQARARAMARRRRKRRQRRMILGGGILLLLLLLAGTIFGITTHKKNKAREALLAEGITAMESGSYEEAIGKFDQAVEGSKGKVGKFEEEVLSYRGEAEYRQKDYEAAVHTFEILIKKDDKKERYKRMACYSQLGLGNYEAALSYGIADAAVYNRMALADIEKGDYDSALAHIEQGKAAEGADGTTLEDLSLNEAVAYEKKSDYAKALELFEAYLEKYGSDENVEREVMFLKTRQGGSGE